MKSSGPPSQATALKLLVVLSRAAASVQRQVLADIGGRGLTPGEFGVLEALYHKGPLLLGDLQRKILVSSGGITFLVDRLVEKGLVERTRCPDDRRARYAALTPKGEGLIAEIFPAHARRVAEVMAPLGRAEQEEAIRLLRTLGRAADASTADQ